MGARCVRGKSWVNSLPLLQVTARGGGLRQSCRALPAKAEYRVRDLGYLQTKPLEVPSPQGNLAQAPHAKMKCYGGDYAAKYLGEWRVS